MELPQYKKEILNETNTALKQALALFELSQITEQDYLKALSKLSPKIRLLTHHIKQ